MAFKDDSKCILLGDTASIAATEGDPITDARQLYTMASFADIIVERGTVFRVDKLLSKWVHPGEFIAFGEITAGPLAGVKVEVRGLFVSGPDGGYPNHLSSSFARHMGRKGVGSQ